MKAKHIILVGSAGSGKSYLAKQIAAVTRYPLFHLDVEYWKPGWAKPPREEWLKKQEKMTAGERWIIDGNYKSSLERRFAACDTVIFMDINRLACIINTIWRQGKKRSDLPEYLSEKFDKEFFDFLKWIWAFPKTDRSAILAMHVKYAEKPFYIVKNRREARKLVEELRRI